MNYEDMMEAFRHIFRDIESKQDLTQVLCVLNEYFTLQEKVQQLPLRLRLKYWACTTVIYFYLQMNKQLGRDVGSFSDSVRKDVYKVFSTLMRKYNENGFNE